jgi:tetratricopeptide (TPR) repeat protein
LYNISIALLEIAALLWTPEDNNIFKNMTQSINKFYPKHSDPIVLVEMKAMCHHIRALLYSDIWEEHRQIAPTLLKIFQTHNKVASKIPTAERIHGKNHMYMMPTSQEIACQALLILHHYLCNLSPLTLATLFPDNSNNDYFDEATPTPTPNKSDGMGYNNEVYPDFDEELQQHPLFDIHHRIELLNVLYHKLPCLSVLKAVTALSLGQYSRIVSKDKQQAESVLFESVFIFDRTPAFVESIPSIMCDNGTKSLIEFALILTENNKYPYAALAYRAAVDNNRLVHLEHDVELISELAVLSTKNDDWKSAVYYYQELLDRAYAEGNVPKVVYLSEKLSEQYVERGDFRNAEQYITRAATFVKSTSGKTGDFELTLQLKLAHLFLQGYYFERGIDLLAKMMEEKLTPIQKCLVFTNLAEAYLKKRWLRECDFVLNKLGPLLEHHVIREANGVDEIKVLDIAARCYYRTGNYAYALYSVNIALNRCSTPSRLAQLFFLKGKIFQALSKSSTPIDFPTSFHVYSVQKHPIFCQFLDPMLFPDQWSSSFVQYQEYLQSIPSSPTNGTSTTTMQQNGYFLAQSPVPPHTPSPILTSGIMKNAKTPLATSPLAYTIPTPVQNQPPPPQQAHKPLTLEDILYNKRYEYSNPGELLQDCLSCYEQSLYYYGAVSDEISVAKVRLRMARSQLDYLFIPVTMLQIDPESVVQMPLPIDPNKRDNDRVLDVRFIDEAYITPAMDTAVRTTHVLLSIDAYITRAEARYLEGRKTAAQAFWTECRDVFFTLIINDGEVVVARGGPPGFLERLLLVLGRLVRLLFCFDTHFINKNLAVIDTFLSLEIEVDQVLKRSGDNNEAKELYTYDSGNESPSDSDTDVVLQDNPLISQNRIYEAMPYNSSIAKGKSLPFLRRNRKTASLTRTSSSRRKGLTRMMSSGTGSQGSSTSGSTKSASTENGLIDGAGMTIRVTERVWSCFFRMKQHSRKYSQQSMDETDLCHRNQQSMRRLYALMSALRSRNALNSASNDPDSLGNSSGNNLVGGNITSSEPIGGPSATIHHSARRHQDLSLFNFASLDTASTTTTTEENASRENEEPGENGDIEGRRSPRRSVTEIDKQIQNMSLASGDLILVNCMLRTLGNSTSDTTSEDLLTTSTLENQSSLNMEINNVNAYIERPSSLNNSPSNQSSLNDNRAQLIHVLRHRRQDSLPSDTSILEAFSTKLDSKLLSRLVYILQIDDVLVYYIPKPGKKMFHRFGGRRAIYYRPTSIYGIRVNSPTVNGSPIMAHNRLSLGIQSLDKSLSDSNLNSLSGLLHVRGISGSTSNDNISGMSGNRTNIKNHSGTVTLSPNVLPNREKTELNWLVADFENFVNALLIQGRRERRSSGGLEQIDEIITMLRTSLFKGPWSYRPPHKARVSISPTTPSIDYRALYGGVIGGGGNANTLTLSKRKLLQGPKFSFRGARDPASMLPALNDLHITERPLICICSKHLQVVPWELMFDDFVTRAFSLRDITRKRQRKHKERYMPTYFCFYSEDEQKFIAPVERQRKEWLCHEFKRNACLSVEDNAILFHDMLPNLPLHTPLIQYGKKPKAYKSRYKHVNFIKLSQIADKPTQIITHIESYLTAPQYPVFIFTLADLMDLSEAILCILSYRPDCTLLFIAEGAMIAAVEMLMDMQNMYIRNGQLAGNCSSRQGYQFLAHCIHVLRKQLNVPMVIINPPLHS